MDFIKFNTPNKYRLDISENLANLRENLEKAVKEVDKLRSEIIAYEHFHTQHHLEDVIEEVDCYYRPQITIPKDIIFSNISPAGSLEDFNDNSNKKPDSCSNIKLLRLSDIFCKNFKDVLDKLQPGSFLWIVYPRLPEMVRSNSENKKSQYNCVCPIDIKLVQIIKIQGSVICLNGPDLPDHVFILNVVPYEDGHNPASIYFSENYDLKQLPGDILIDNETNDPYPNYDDDVVIICEKFMTDSPMSPVPDSLENSGDFEEIELIEPEVDNAVAYKASDNCAKKTDTNVTIETENVEKEMTITSTENSDVGKESSNIQVTTSESPPVTVPEAQLLDKGMASQSMALQTFLDQSMDFDEDESQKDYQCLTCFKPFSSNSARVYHLKKFGRYKLHSCCAICNKTLVKKKEVIAHARQHEKEKLYKCDICSKVFAKKGILYTHIKTHNNPYKCDKCKRRFSQKDHLIRHKWVHSGVKPYECPICKRQYVNETVFNFHMEYDCGAQCKK